jgi:hypothetical protein
VTVSHKHQQEDRPTLYQTSAGTDYHCSGQNKRRVLQEKASSSKMHEGKYFSVPRQPGTETSCGPREHFLQELWRSFSAEQRRRAIKDVRK